MSYLFFLSAFCHNVTPRHYHGKQVWQDSLCLQKLSGETGMAHMARYVCKNTHLGIMSHLFPWVHDFQTENTVSHMFLPGCFAGEEQCVAPVPLSARFAGRGHRITPIPSWVFCRQRTLCHTCSFLSVLQAENMVSHMFLPECFACRKHGVTLVPS